MIVMSKRNISYISHDEPTFIKRFKEKVGYKESASVDSKVSVTGLNKILMWCD